jgi:hypothetical protein
MSIDQEPKTKIIDAYFDQRNTILDVSKTVGKSRCDVIAVMKMTKQELQLPQKVMHGDTHIYNKKDVNQVKEDCQSRPIYTKAYRFFSSDDSSSCSDRTKGFTTDTTKWYMEYLMMKHLPEVPSIWGRL